MSRHDTSALGGGPGGAAGTVAPPAPGRAPDPGGGWRRGGLLAGALVALLGVGAIAASPAAAFDARAAEDVVVEEGEVVEDDLYAAADTVTVRGTVEGDLVVAARVVTIEGTVEGDLLGAAATVAVEGAVTDDLRVAAQVLTVDEGAEVGDDVVSAAFSLEAGEGSTVGGSVVHTGYQALLAGEVAEDVRGAMAGLELRGEVGGDIDLGVGGPEDDGAPFAAAVDTPVPAVEPGLTVTETAVVAGDLTYRSTAEGDIDPGADIRGSVVFDEEVQPSAADEATDELVDSLRLLLTLLVAGTLLLWLAPRLVTGAGTALRERPLASLGLGALVFPAAVLLSIVLLLATVLLAVVLGIVSLGGLVAAVVGLGGFAQVTLVLVLAVAAGLLAPVVVTTLGGRLALRRPAEDGVGGRLLALVVGVVVYALVRAVPVLGPIVAFLVVLLGLGALVLLVWRSRTPAPAPQPAPVGGLGTAAPPAAAAVTQPAPPGAPAPPAAGGGPAAGTPTAAPGEAQAPDAPPPAGPPDPGGTPPATDGR